MTTILFTLQGASKPSKWRNTPLQFLFVLNMFCWIFRNVSLARLRIEESSSPVSDDHPVILPSLLSPPSDWRVSGAHLR